MFYWRDCNESETHVFANIDIWVGGCWDSRLATSLYNEERADGHRRAHTNQSHYPAAVRNVATG